MPACGGWGRGQRCRDPLLAAEDGGCQRCRYQLLAACADAYLLCIPRSGVRRSRAGKSKISTLVFDNGIYKKTNDEPMIVQTIVMAMTVATARFGHCGDCH